MLKRTAITLFCLLTSCCALAQSSRHLIFHYEFTVRDVEQGKPLRVWIPLAHSSEFQTVRVLSEKGDLPLKPGKERKYGDQMLYAETKKASKPEYKFAVAYDVVRREHIALTDEERKESEGATGPSSPSIKQAAFKQYLAPDKLVPTSGLPAEIAGKTVAGKTGDMQKARAMYEYVLANMRYDKSGTGWGHGDTLWACDSKRGNCTDFHSLFISMARSQGIPARFEIGFPLPRDKHEGEIPGYHCWAEFYTARKGWVPVDISEAWKDKSRAEYFFGAHDDNRVAFTMGRDLVLNPPQAGDPLNYFVYPYVELDGKKYENVSNHFSFADLPGAQKDESHKSGAGAE
jgi:transglutaminase-like putative cysteine protease